MRLSKLQEWGFNKNHFALLTVGTLLFVVLVIPKTGIKLSAVFSRAAEPNNLITYEQARNDVYAQMDLGGNDPYVDVLENQFALLDRGDANGAVLGEAIGLGEIPSVEQLYSPEQLSLIPVQVNNESGAAAVQKYAERMLRIESYYNTVELFANLNGTDDRAITETEKKVTDMIEAMNQLDVPKELVDYHRYNIMYYQTLGKLGTALIANDPKLGQYSQAMFSLLDKIGEIKSEIKSTYGVSL